MAPKKVANKGPASAEKLHQVIHSLGERIRSHAASSKQSIKKPVANNTKTVQFVEPEIPVAPPVLSDDLAANPYAQEIFMAKTNVRDVAKKCFEQQGHPVDEKALRSFRTKLYRAYSSDPKARIREPLDGLRFESQYYEYRFFLALNKPLHSQEEYQEYKDQLEAAGVSECWVTMRKHNMVLKCEDTIVSLLKKNFKRWSGKLEKLDFYLTDMISKQPCFALPQKTKIAKETSEDDQLLENLLKRSNARSRLSEAQIRARFPRIKRNLLAPDKLRLKWLLFDDDELNKRFQRGTHQQPEAVAEIELVEATPLQDSVDSGSRPGSAGSGDSEMAHMRSEMAMTQPQEMLPMEVSRFANTNELVDVLEPAIEPPLPEMVMVDEPHIEPIVTDEHSEELSSMLTPGQTDVVEVSDSPVKQGEVEIKQEFFLTLDYLKEFTNIEQVITDLINQQSPRTAERGMRKLNSNLERYYELKKSTFQQNALPKELRFLTRKERRERLQKTASSDMNRLGASSTVPEPSAHIEVNPHTETPSVPKIPRKSRLINYAEDDDEIAPKRAPTADPVDTLSMPHSDEFLPSVFSTQLPGDDSGLAPRRQDTPFQSPINQVPPQSTSRVPTPAFASNSPNTTVIANKSPAKSPAIKRELNTTSYEGEVEFVELNDAPIEIHDSMNSTSQNIPELLGRQPSCIVAMPDKLRGLVNTLFRENQDATLSQGSGTSSGSGSKLSQEMANASAPSMGFHQPTAPTKNARKSDQQPS